MFKYNRKNLVYLFILLIPFFLFFSRTKLFGSFKFTVANLFSGPIRIVSFPLIELKKILYYHRTFEEYKKKKLEVDRLKTRLVGMEEVVRENTRLEKLLDFKRRLVYSASAASVVGRDLSRWNSSFIIDKGEDDGVELGQPVVNEIGVVGKIAEVSGQNSKVIMLTDPQFSVAVMVQRSRESGVISGTLEGMCRLKFVKENADIRVGDKVITSKLSTTFPESLVIGDVIEIRPGRTNMSKECIVQPAVSFSQLEEVLILSK